MNTGLAKIADVLLVFFYLLIAPGQIQRDFGHIMNIRIPDIPHRNSGISIALLDLHESVGSSQIRSGPNADILCANLIEEEEVIVRRLCGPLPCELEARFVRNYGCRCCTC